MKIIVTGADGFVGGHLVPLLLKKFKRSQLLCLVGTGKSQLARRVKLMLKQNRIKFLTVDLLNQKSLKKIPKSPDVVIHLAANTDTASRDHRINDLGSRNLLAALNLTSKTHFIYTGTTVIYSGRSDAKTPITEYTLPKPTNEYGRSKLRAEEFLREVCLKNRIPLTIVRINTVYGDDPRKHKLFVSLKNLVSENSIFSRLNWPGLTSLIHVDDVAEIILGLAKNPPKPGRMQTFLLYAESLTLSQISELMHWALKKNYHQIKLPKLFWEICSGLRKFVPVFEKFLPGRIYNTIWRSGLITENVIYCKSKLLFKIYPDWKPRRLKDTIKDTLV